MDIKDYVGKENFFYVRRGNVAIRESLRIAKSLGYSTLLIQDEGGWMTYSRYGKFNIIRIPTKNGIINAKDLIPNSILLINSLPGYHSLQDMDEIAKKHNILVINDVTGSIPYKKAIKGDIIIGSFGKWKPINLGGGGFIAFGKEIKYNKIEEHEINEKRLLSLNLNERIKKIMEIKKRVMNDLSDFQGKSIGDEYGYNPIYTFNTEKEKSFLIEYCNNNNLEYVECPKEIRTLKKAISIEVKRKFDEI